MRLCFFHSDKQRERDLARAFCAGAIRHGVNTVRHELSAMPALEGFDMVAMVGVKSKRLFERCRAAGIVPIMLDKGYVRTRVAGARVWEYWRVSVGAHHPTEYLMNHKMPEDRWLDLGAQMKPWRRRGLQVVIAGSSAKYHDFYGLEDPTAWANAVYKELRRHTDRPIVYRPKPSWKEAVEIAGTHYSRPGEAITDALSNAWALVTHGSNACFEAALLGVPSIVLGSGIGQPISSDTLGDIEAPACGKRLQWLYNLAYCQWTEAEMESGQAWEHIKKWNM